MRKIYVEFERAGQAAVYDHEWVRLAMQRVEELEKFSEPVQTYQQAINLLQWIANWLRDHNHAHYFAVDTKQANEDGVPVACIMHTLHLDEQFMALHRYVEQSRQNVREKPMEASDEN